MQMRCDACDTFPHGANVQLLVVIFLSLSHSLYRKGKSEELGLESTHAELEKAETWAHPN